VEARKEERTYPVVREGLHNVEARVFRTLSVGDSRLDLRRGGEEEEEEEERRTRRGRKERR